MSTQTVEAPEALDSAAGTATRSPRVERTWPAFLARQAIVPVLLGLVLFALYYYIQNRTLDSIERRTVNEDFIHQALIAHIKLTAVASFFVVIIAVPLGILLTRRRARWLSPIVLGIANIGQATPAVGFLILLTLAWKPGFQTAVIGLIAYSVLPVLRNTVVGVQQVDKSLVDAGRGMGMTGRAVLARVELPLAVPVILAGIRTALVLSVGVATLATLVSAGGLGEIIITGIKLQRTPVLIVGSVLTIVLALAVDWLGGLVEDLLRPRGL